MDFESFIKPELLILVPVLYIIGIGLKKSKISNRVIPITLGIVAVILSAFWVIADSDIYSYKDVANAIFVSFTQGMLCAGASVYVNQLIVQAKKDERD